MLTDKELHALEMTGDLYNYITTNVIANGKGRDNDVREFAAMIHTIQRFLMAQSACRAHPGQFRLLGASDCGPKRTYSGVANSNFTNTITYSTWEEFKKAVKLISGDIFLEGGDLSTANWYPHDWGNGTFCLSATFSKR